jgi:hypothetical protein
MSCTHIRGATSRSSSKYKFHTTNTTINNTINHILISRLLKKCYMPSFFKESDKGSRFFHALMNQRYKKNFISTIHNNSGSLSAFTDEVGEVVVQYFQQLLGSSSTIQPLDESVIYYGPRLNDTTHGPLLATVSNDVIKSVLFNIGDDKSPSPDGYCSFFFKKSWDMVG